MDDAHKKELAQGRAEARAVKAYLDHLETHKPKRGRKRTLETVEAQLAAVRKELAELDEGTSVLTKLGLIGQEETLTIERDRMKNRAESASAEDLEAGFVEVAASYAQRKGLRRSTFARMGVPGPVLTKAGL